MVSQCRARSNLSTLPDVVPKETKKRLFAKLDLLTRPTFRLKYIVRCVMPFHQRNSCNNKKEKENCTM